MRGRHLRLGIVAVFACGGGSGDASSEGLTTAADMGGPTGMEPTSTSAGATGSTSVTTQGASGETTGGGLEDAALQDRRGEAGG